MWTQPYNDKVRFFERYKDGTGNTFVLSCTMPKDTAQNRRKAKDKLAIQPIPEKCRFYQQFGDFSLLENREM